eukprot:UN24220
MTFAFFPGVHNFPTKFGNKNKTLACQFCVPRVNSKSYTKIDIFFSHKFCDRMN